MKLLMVTTISETMNAFLLPHVNKLVENGVEVHLAFSTHQPLKKEFLDMGCIIHEISFDRNPLAKENRKAFNDIKKLIILNEYDIIHTHTPIASAIIRLAAIGTPAKIFYTAHGFHFHKSSKKLNWMIYFPIEWILSFFTDTIITINKEDFKRANKYFKSNNIEYIPGIGFEIDKFKNVNLDKEKEILNLGIPKESFIIISVGELNSNKNHKVIIEAIAKIKKDNIYYIIAGEGPLENQLIDMVNKNNLEGRVKLLGYRDDIEKIYKLGDIFAFPSIREGLGLAALEAMCSGMPIITSNVHGIIDYSKNEISGFAYAPNDVEGFASGILKLYEDEGIRNKFSKNNIEIVKKYDIKNVIPLIYKLYKIGE